MKVATNSWGLCRLQHCLILIIALCTVGATQSAVGQRGKSAKEETPGMQTDSLTGYTFDFLNESGEIDGRVRLPVLGRAKVGENNSALPQDRSYFVFKHFHNSLENSLGDGFGGTLVERDLSLDRYNIGLEKTFSDGLWSIEVRLPFLALQTPVITGDFAFLNSEFSSHIGSIGNVSVVTKLLMSASDTGAWSAGLGLSAPTADDSQIRVQGEVYTVRNEAVHLFPYVAFLSAPTQRTFVQGFLQLDVPVNGNRLEARVPGAGTTNFGSMRDQILMYVDLSAGYWLYQNKSGRGLVTGVASAMELHYTSALEDENTLVGTTSSGGGSFGRGSFSGFADGTDFALGNADNRFDVVNVNAGIYTTFNRFTLYTGISAPIDGTNRFFDMEAQMSINFGL